MIKELLKKSKTIPSLISLGLIILAICTFYISTSFMSSASEKILTPLNTVNSIQNQIIENTYKNVETTSKTNILKKQYLISGEIKKYYLQTGKSYYKYHFAFSISSIIFTTLLTIAIFLIANKGWQKSNLILKSFLLTTIILSSIFYFLPNVMSNKENLKNNSEKIKIYGKIQTDILKISNKLEESTAKQIDSIISNNYDRISNDLDFFNSIDDSKLQNEYINLMKQYKSGN